MEPVEVQALKGRLEDVFLVWEQCRPLITARLKRIFVFSSSVSLISASHKLFYIHSRLIRQVLCSLTESSH
jgi:hypothetical protein